MSSDHPAILSSTGVTPKRQYRAWTIGSSEKVTPVATFASREKAMIRIRRGGAGNGRPRLAPS